MTKTSKQAQAPQELKIDLDQIMNPHSAILKAYADANAKDLFFPYKPEYMNEKRIFEASKSSGSPVKHLITGIYRKAAGSKEYVFWHEHLQTFDYFKNSIDHTRFVGRYEVPVITRNFAINPAGITSDTTQVKPESGPPEIESMKTIHEFEFEELKPQLMKWKEQNIITDETHLYCWVGPIKYSKPYTWEEWLNLSIDDLVVLGKVGNRFDGILKPGDAGNIETLRQIVKEELQKGILK